MDGENTGKPYFLMDDLGGKPPIFGNPHVKVLRLRNEISSPLASPQRCLCVRQESSRQASPKKSRQKNDIGRDSRFVEVSA